jgi:hypothetical protein
MIITHIDDIPVNEYPVFQSFAKSKNVTGVGVEARTESDIKSEYL